MSVELASVHPTRIELLRLRRRKSMAEGIIDILKKDLDTLTVKLFEFIKGIPDMREKLNTTLNDAYSYLTEAEMIAGSRKIEETSLVAQPIDFSIKVEEKVGILGIMLPVIKFQEETVQAKVPRFSIIDTPIETDESALKIKDALYQAIKLAEIELAMKEILDVMSKKKRQINRIQYQILPQLESSIRYIELILEETERQDSIRVRVLQRKRKERAQKAV